jgi:hypothetical protein
MKANMTPTDSTMNKINRFSTLIHAPGDSDAGLPD